MGDAARQLADGFHLLRLVELRFGGALFGDVPADEEMPSDRLRPRAHPVQDHGPAIPVDKARLEVAHEPAAPRRAHGGASHIEILGMNEFDCATSDHLFRPVAEDRQ